MKKAHLIYLLFLSLFASVFADAHSNDDYPRTKAEKEMDEMDSVLGDHAITFSPTKIKNEKTKSHASNSVNKYLWKATLETLSFMPLTSSDISGGVVITDWYTPQNKQNYSFKINVFITEDNISPEAIQVKVFERVYRQGSWVDNPKSSDLATTLESKILKKARELYIADNEKNKF